MEERIKKLEEMMDIVSEKLLDPHISIEFKEGYQKMYDSLSREYTEIMKQKSDKKYRKLELCISCLGVIVPVCITLYEHGWTGTQIEKLTKWEDTNCMSSTSGKQLIKNIFPKSKK